MMKVSTAAIFLPDDVKSIFYADMSKNGLNEHLMLGCLVDYVLLQSHSDILDRLATSTKSTMCKYLNEKVDSYLTD